MIYSFKINQELSFKEEVLTSFFSERTIIYVGEETRSINIYESYKDKFNIQKLREKSSVQGYEVLLNILQKRNKEEQIRVINLYTKENVYILFSSDENEIFSVLKSNNSNVNKIISLINNYNEYKNTDYIFFFNGKEVDRKIFLEDIDNDEIIKEQI